MSEPFLAEIRMVGFNFAPKGWAYCDGQLLPISQNQSLYSLLGTTYGGDGRTNFALPDLRSRTPIHKSDGHPLGQKGGVETLALSTAETAAHTHQLKASSSEGNQILPVNNILATAKTIYRDPEVSGNTAMKSGSISDTGGGQSHNNMQPYCTLTFCIALQGLYPSRN